MQQCDLEREGQGNLELFGLGLRHVLWLVRTRRARPTTSW
jgi:hypothetical protein